MMAFGFSRAIVNPVDQCGRIHLAGALQTHTDLLAGQRLEEGRLAPAELVTRVTFCIPIPSPGRAGAGRVESERAIR